MICVIIRNLHSDGHDTETHAIGQNSPYNCLGFFEIVHQFVFLRRP
jgi:hypothetical protein